MAEADDGTTTVAVDPDERSDWALDPNVFGRFSEHPGSVMYPGVFEDYLKNGSFEVWHESGRERASGIVFPEVGAEEEWDTRGSGSSARGRRSTGWTSGRSAPKTTTRSLSTGAGTNATAELSLDGGGAAVSLPPSSVAVLTVAE